MRRDPATGFKSKALTMGRNSKYWFLVRSHGWGWGLPCAWQGWVVYAVALVLLASGPFIYSPFKEPVAFQIYTWAVIAVLVLICWLKGEPPRWRWGK